MPKKITEAQKKIAKVALIAGKSTREAGQLAGISHEAAHGLFTEVDGLKKELRADFEAETGDRIKKLAKDLLDIAERSGAALTDDKIKGQSGAAIATTLGIVLDKMQLLTGGATENVQITAGPSGDSFLQKLKAKSITIESAKIEPVKSNITLDEADKTVNTLNNEGKE